MTTWTRYRRPLAALAIAAVGFGVVGMQSATSFAADSDTAQAQRMYAPKNILPAGGIMKPKGSITSLNGVNRLVLQDDSNLVLYGAKDAVLWASNTAGKKVDRLVMQKDGNLVMYTAENDAVWDTKTDVKVGGEKTVLRVTNSGGLAMLRDSKIVWSQGDVSKLDDTLVAGEALKPEAELVSADGNYRFVHQGDGNLVIYNAVNKPTWESRTDGKPTKTLDVQKDGNVVLYSPADKPLWETRTDVPTGGDTTKLVMQDSGKLQVLRGTRVVWDSSSPANNPNPIPPGQPGNDDDQSDAAKAAKVVRFAEDQLGKGFQLGAKGPSKWGNPELVVAAWASVGISMPSSASDIFHKQTKKHVKWDKRAAGDVMCYMLQDTREVRCGIYVGQDSMIESTSEGKGVYKHAIQRNLFGSSLVRPTIK